MFFFAFFWAFFHSSLAPVFNIGGVWPPEAITVMQASGIPLTNTILLVSSGATVTWAHHAIRGGAKNHTLLGLIFTIIGSSMNLESVINFSDSMIFAMSVPNIIGLYFLSSELKKDIKKLESN